MSEDGMYDGFCSFGDSERHHVFDRAFSSDPVPGGAYPICRCGHYRKKYCKCPECDNGHWRAVTTDENERLRHEIMKLNLRLSAVEGRSRAVEGEVGKAIDELPQ